MMQYQWEGIENFRELGGIALPGGKKVKSGLLFRCGDLADATDRDVAELERLGIRTIIDLRDATEREFRPDREIPGAEQIHLPAMPRLAPPGPEGEAHRAKFRRNPGAVYDAMYQQLASNEVARSSYRQMFEVLLRQPGAPVLWHCRQGKDRTGVAATLILAALGASWEEQRTEYLRTNTAMQPAYDAMVARGEPEEELWFQRQFLFVAAPRIERYREEACSMEGSFDTYLSRQMGLTEEKLTLLRQAYSG